MGIGNYEHIVRIELPSGAPQPDGDGGSTQAYADLATRWHCSIEPATARSVERIVAGTSSAQPTAVLEGQYIAGVTTAARVWFGSRLFSVVGVRNVLEFNRILQLAVVEVVG